MAESNVRRVDLGYVEKTDPWRLESRFFPSKVGGKPAWLALADVPTYVRIKCSKCSTPCIFLCQVYAPIEDMEHCFHRTIFIFVCPKPECFKENDNSNFIVFRCQMGRKNDFYPFEPPVEDESWRQDLKIDHFCKLCVVCGIRSKDSCGRCKATCYCSKEHQKIHWKAGHKEECTAGIISIPKGVLLFPEFELVMDLEDEEACDSDTEENDCKDETSSENKNMEEFKRLVTEGKAGVFQGEATADSDLLQMAAVEEDRVFGRFREIVARHPAQVLRYDKGGAPVWVAEKGTPEEGDIPPCDSCGGPRVFEFQVMPQLLFHLHNNALDWGTLAVYTCRDSCPGGVEYQPEFLWRQDFTRTGAP